MRRLVPFLAVLALFTVAACEQQTTSPTGTDATSADAGAAGAQATVDVIVQLDREFAPGPHGANQDRAASVAEELGVTPRYTYGTALFGFAGPVPEGRIEALREDPRVVLVERDQPVHAIAQTLPAGIDRIEVDQNSTASIDGTDDAMDVDIGIIDTGIDLDHPDLDAHDAINCIDSGATADDDNGHGTHVAGSAAAIDNDSHVVGAAPGARVHAVKVLDSGGGGTISSVICGIDYVTKNADVFEVANMSLGAQAQSDNMRSSIQNSLDAGIYYAVAAGNDAADVYGSDGTFGTSDDFIPAAYPEVAAVSAMADYDGTSGGGGGSPLFIGCGRIDDDTFADCFSNFSQSVVSTNPVNSPGAAIDLAAPGVSVLSTTNDGSTGNKTGTSMSSPHVAGIAALYIVQNGLSPSSASDVNSIRQALIDAGQPQTEWGPSDTKDPDSNPERLVWAVFGSSDDGSTDDPPSVSWVNPTDGETVSGTITVQIDASDAEDDTGTLDVTYTIDGGTERTTTYNSTSGYYEDSWDTTAQGDGDHTLEAKAKDSAGQTTTSSITVTVDNTDDGSGTAPVINTFDVSTRTTGPWNRADVTWAVSDDDGDLSSVETELLDSGGNVLDSETSSVSGSSASGEHNLRTRSNDAASVRLIVTDAAGNETSDSQSVSF